MDAFIIASNWSKAALNYLRFQAFTMLIGWLLWDEKCSRQVNFCLKTIQYHEIVSKNQNENLVHSGSTARRKARKAEAF